jgi:DNA-binding NarL/FixJ family response regulator
LLAVADSAVSAGRWAEARTAFEQVIEGGGSAEAYFGLAVTLWWQGEDHASLVSCRRAYALFRRSGQWEQAVRCAVWLAITYKANFANLPAANGWLGRAERMLHDVEPGVLQGWVWVARAYRIDDLVAAEDLTRRALAMARTVDDVDLELVAMSQLGLILVGRGQTAAGFALLDEAVVAALAGEPLALDTVVYTCCDMLSACDLAHDLRRAAQWCDVADDFVSRYGCPFLYAECRIYYGGVLTARGRWDDAERALKAALRVTGTATPSLHAKGLIQLADLRIRQGRLEEATELVAQLDQSSAAGAEGATTTAALWLARGQAVAAQTHLRQLLPSLEGHPTQLAIALDLLVDAHLATGDVAVAGDDARRLADLASSANDHGFGALAAGAQGRVLAAGGQPAAASARLEQALRQWSDLELPFEVAQTRFALAVVRAPLQPELAVAQARRALAAFTALGAALNVDRVAAFLRSLGVRAHTGPQGSGQLTLREHEVLQLLGRGLSNPEIAERLHVSRKTAAHHVSHILTKLALRNRAEAAAFAAAVAAEGGWDAVARRR